MEVSYNLRYQKENGGLMTKEQCNFLWRLKHLRNKWLRHDIDHGTDAEIRKKKAQLAETLKFYGFNKKPKSTFDYRQLQVAIVDDMTGFVNLFHTLL